MRILGIETSCDETAIAIVDAGHDVRCSVISSQIAKHAAYGGVIPELAAREHLQAIQTVADQALKAADADWDSIDGIAVTHAPGLTPALLVGLNFAKGLAAARDLPFVAVNHFMAHIFGAFIDHEAALADPATFPIVALVVSGGHTALVEIEADGSARLMGQTLDDAAGEAYDKAAKILNLGYPGGPLIDKLAKEGNPTAFDFPRGLTPGGGKPLAPEDRLNFSFSGLKTSLLTHLSKLTGEPLQAGKVFELPQDQLHDTLASYQEAVVDVLVRKTMWAIEACAGKSVVLCGGVACNSRLRAAMTEAAEANGVKLYIAPPKYCTDNAAMIAGLGYYQLRAGERSSFDVDAIPRLPPFARVPFTDADADPAPA